MDDIFVVFMKGFVSGRVCVELNECKEYSFKEAVEGSDDTQSKSLESEPKMGYGEFIEDFIKHGETYGFKNRYLTGHKIDPDSESDDISCLSSFVEFDSESSLGPSQDLEMAINKGFYVVSVEEFNKNPLKRSRDSEDNEEITKILSKLSSCKGSNKLKTIPNNLICLLKEVSVLIKSDGAIEPGQVYQKIAKQTGLGLDRVMKCVKIEELSSMKNDAYNKFIKSLGLCKAKVKIIEKKNLKWDKETDKILVETERLLENFVNFNNELACFTGKKEDILVLDEVKLKYLDQYFIIKTKRIGSIAIVINVESQECEGLPVSGKIFEDIFEFQMNDFVFD